MKLKFASPTEIFDANWVTKTPALSDEFLDWLFAAFEYAPKKYRLDLDVAFDDLGEYNEEQLQDIFLANMLLEHKRSRGLTVSKNIVAYILIGIGLVFFIAMLLVGSLWTEDNLAKQIFVYVSDIATTVTFWEAMAILVVENAQSRAKEYSLLKRFSKIRFHTKN